MNEVSVGFHFEFLIVLVTLVNEQQINMYPSRLDVCSIYYRMLRQNTILLHFQKYSTPLMLVTADQITNMLK